MIKRLSFKIGLGTIVIIVGFILLLRSCLAGYDERSAIGPSLYFNKDGKELVFSIVQYQKAVSYKSGGGMTTKSVSTTYYLQTNNVVTGEKIAIKKIKHHSDVKNYPIHVMGKCGNIAWVFIGEPMAFDPFTLEKIADKKTIAEKNPFLLGKLPEQSNYYNYDRNANEIIITATDGLKYSLSASSLIARALDEDANEKNPLEVKLKQLEKERKKYRDLSKQNYDWFRKNNALYEQRKMSIRVYQDSSRIFEKRRDELSKISDSLTQLVYQLEEMKDERNDRHQAIKNLNESSISFSNITIEADTINGKWYGLKTAASLEKFYPNFRYEHGSGETERNKLYTATYTFSKPGKASSDVLIDDPGKVSDAVFIQGGFLLNRETALAIQLNDPVGLLVCHREKVGNEGNILLSVISFSGEVKWTVNCGFKDIKDYILSGNRLIVFGTDNKELSSNEINVLNSIVLSTGKMISYDYFTDKMRNK